MLDNMFLFLVKWSSNKCLELHRRMYRDDAKSAGGSLSWRFFVFFCFLKFLSLSFFTASYTGVFSRFLCGGGGGVA